MKKKRIISFFLIISAVLIMCTLIMNALGINALGFLIDKPNIAEIESQQLLQVKQAYLDMKKKSGYPDYMTTNDVLIEEYLSLPGGMIVLY